MSLAASIFAKLSAGTSATAGLIGSDAACRLYPVVAPNGVEVDYAAWQVISDTADNTLGEARGSGSVLVQFSCVGSTYDAALALGDAIAADLDNQTLADSEVVLSVSAQDGFSEATDQFLRIVEVLIFVPAPVAA